MKDSYDQLDWQNGTSAQGYTNYSAKDYDSFAQNPTYRNEFYDEGTEDGNVDNYQESYDQSYDDSYDQSYDNGYYDQGSYDENGQYYNDGYQQTSDYNDPYYAAPPTQYSQEDYDRLAQNPSYRNDNNPYKMEDDQFHEMIVKQKKRDVMQETVDNYLLAGTFGAKHSDAPGMSKDSLLYLLMLGFGAALARLFSLPLWAYPVFATGIGLLFTVIKAFLIDNESKEEALKRCLAPGVILGIGFGFTVYMKSKGF